MNEKINMKKIQFSIVLVSLMLMSIQFTAGTKEKGARASTQIQN
jgi:hypothetical protein